MGRGWVRSCAPSFSTSPEPLQSCLAYSSSGVHEVVLASPGGLAPSELLQSVPGPDVQLTIAVGHCRLLWASWAAEEGKRATKALLSLTNVRLLLAGVESWRCFNPGRPLGQGDTD